MKKPLLNHAERFVILNFPNTLQASIIKFYLARIHFYRSIIKKVN